jgi:hypothetical protein
MNDFSMDGRTLLALGSLAGARSNTKLARPNFADFAKESINFFVLVNLQVFVVAEASRSR